jgi:hypothetical protein
VLLAKNLISWRVSGLIDKGASIEYCPFPSSLFPIAFKDYYAVIKNETTPQQTASNPSLVFNSNLPSFRISDRKQ